MVAIPHATAGSLRAASLGPKRLEEPVDEVIQRRVIRVAAQRLPEERPGSLEPVTLEDLVEPVREVAEAVEADRRGGGEDHQQDDPAAARHGPKDSAVRSGRTGSARLGLPDSLG